MCLLECFQLKKECMEQQQGDFVFRIPSCFHHVCVCRLILLSPGQLRCLWPKPFMTLLQINLGTRDANTKDRNVDPPHLDLKIDCQRRLRSMNWWQYLEIYIYTFIDASDASSICITCMCDPRICSVFHTYKYQIYTYIYIYRFLCKSREHM